MLPLLLLLLPFALLGLPTVVQVASSAPSMQRRGVAPTGARDSGSDRSADCLELPEGSRVAGRYRLGRLIGRGGMGAVYEAEDERTGRNVALKMTPISDLRRLEACRLEALLGQKIQGPGLVPVDASGCWRGAFYMTMERLDGRDLSRVLAEEGPVAVDQVLQWGIEAAEALEQLHRAGVVHCDVKPSNLFVCSDGSLRLFDLGIARLAGEACPHSDQILGSPNYMAPERFGGAAGDAPSDLWALGATLYEALAGVPAYPGGNLPQVCVRVMHGSVEPLSEVRPGVPPALEGLISALLDPDVEARPRSASAVAEVLRSIRGHFRQAA